MGVEDKNNGTGDVLKLAGEFVNSLPGLNDPGDIIEQAEQIAAMEEFGNLSRKISEQFGDFLDGLQERTRVTATVLALPLLDELDEFDDGFSERVRDAEGEDPERVSKLKREKQLAYAEVGLKAIKVGSTMLKHGLEMDRIQTAWSLNTQSPYEISSAFMGLVGRRLGDQQQNLAIGWQLVVNSITGNHDIPLEEQIEDARKLLSDTE